MKKILYLVIVLVFLVQPGLTSIGAVVPDKGESSGEGDISERRGFSEAEGGMPTRPVPLHSIPYHDPAHLSKAGDYSTQVSQTNADGIEETVTLTGLDAMLADGVIDDPMQGNYRLVDLDKIMMGTDPPTGNGTIQSFSAISGTVSSPVEDIPGSLTFSTDTLLGITAGDLNADGLDEQISAWMDGSSDVYLSAGEMPGSIGKATSDPAAVAHNDGTIDLLVRGYDQTLWHRHYDGAAWEDWNNNAMGVLLSGPGIASRRDGSFDAFAIALDNLTYRRHWDGSQWSPDWELVDDPGTWIQVSEIPTRTTVLSWNVDAPAAVARDPDLIDIFRRGTDNQLHWRHFNGTSWEDWVSLEGVITSAPSAVSKGADHILVFANGMDGMVWYRTYTSGTWERWERLAMPGAIRASSAPTAIAKPGSNTINVFLRGTDDALWTIERNGNAWGAWETLGGELASGAGVAAGDNVIDLFALQDFGDFLHNHYNGAAWSGWGDWDGLDPCCQNSTAGINSPEYLELTTGHFTGDGRSQVAVSYVHANTIYINIYDALVGFSLFERAARTSADPIIADTNGLKRLSIVAGDFDGDGTDEIATLHTFDSDLNSISTRVRLFDVNINPQGSWAIEPKGEETKHITGETIIDVWEFGMTAGDFNADGDEELAAVILNVELTAPHPFLDIPYSFQILDIDIPVPSQMDPTQVFWGEERWYRELYNAQIFALPGGIEIEAGNLDGEFYNEAWGYNGDEIVVTLAHPIDDETIDYRRIYAYGFTGIWDRLDLASLDLPCSNCETWVESDTLALGDFNRDLKDEIVFLHPTQNPQLNLEVYSYWFDPEQPQIDPYILHVGNYNSSFSFSEGWVATGNFTGESLRVGPPTYRVQRETGDLIAIIKAPPKHKDTLDGVTYDINSTDEDTYARYENEIGETTEMSINVYRDWAMARGSEWGFGDPTATHFNQSLIRTYGEHFENTTTAYNETRFGSDANASNDDIVIYSVKDLEIWEYPVYSDNSKTPKNHIILTWPVPTEANTGTLDEWKPGNTICDFWYAPDHQLNNVWSYARDETQLIPIETLLQKTPRTIGAVPTHVWYEWGTYNQVDQVKDVHFNVDSHKERQFGGEKIKIDFGVEVLILSYGTSYETWLPHSKTTTDSSYKEGALSTHKVSGSEDTEVHVYFNDIEADNGYSYGVTSYLYWAQPGLLVLDYTTEPTNTGFWNQYNLPDPAFILPWREADCPGKDLFSKDIFINPPYANIGETVEITATVHNLSPEPGAGDIDVTVRFCQGYPSYGCNQIGEDIVQLDARGRADANISWEVNGIGTQEIYALIDPGNDIAEMHDEVTNSENNNNLGFGILEVGDSGYLDPGGVLYYDYQYLTYTDTQDLAINFFLPNGAITETARVELTSLPPLQVGQNTMTRHGFALNTYKGGSNPDQPWDLNFSPMPGAVMLNYSDEDVTGLDENNLILYTYNIDTGIWEDAACGEYQRYPEENWMLVPVCNTGKFALLGQGTFSYLPLISK